MARRTSLILALLFSVYLSAVVSIPAQASHNVAGLAMADATSVSGDHWSAVAFELLEPSRLTWEVRPTFGQTEETALGVYIFREDGSFQTFATVTLFWEKGSAHILADSAGGEPVLTRHDGSAAGYTWMAITTSGEVPAGRYTAVAYAVSANAQLTETFLYAKDGSARILAHSDGPGLFLARAEDFRGTASVGVRGNPVVANIPTAQSTIGTSFSRAIEDRLVGFFGTPPVGGECALTVSGPQSFSRTGCGLVLSGPVGGTYDFRVERYLYAGAFASESAVHGADWRLPVEVTRDIPYGDPSGAGLQLDLYRPVGAGTALPSVVDIPGDLWAAGSRDELKGEAVRLAQEGFVVAVPDIQRPCVDGSSSPCASHPASLRDLERVIEWLRAESAAVGADPERMGVLGAGGGGHLAQLLGVNTSGASRPEAVVSWSGPPDLTGLLGSPLESAAESLVGCAHDVCPDLWEQASPVLHAGSGDAPTLLVHSEEELVPASDIDRLAALLSDAGVPVVVRTLSGAKHGREYAVDVWDSSVDFLAEHLAA